METVSTGGAPAADSLVFEMIKKFPNARVYVVPFFLFFLFSMCALSLVYGSDSFFFFTFLQSTRLWIIGDEFHFDSSRRWVLKHFSVLLVYSIPALLM